MTVSRILKGKGSSIVSVTGDQTVEVVCGLLSGNKIGGVVVVDASGGLAGIFTERDVVNALAREGTDAFTRPVSSYMTRDVETVGLDATVASVMARMTAGRFRHMPVVEGGRLVGLVSIGDVVKHRIAEAEREADEMRTYISMA